MGLRYDNRAKKINNNTMYGKQFVARGVTHIRQYTSPHLRYPTEEEIVQLSVIGHAWALGDRFYKLAHEHYGNESLWWVLAWYNQVPLEADLKFGDVIEIPFPLNKVLRFFEV